MILMKNIVKIKFNSDDELYLNKTSVFHENNKYYSHVV